MGKSFVYELRDVNILRECIHASKKITDEAVHKATMKYIAEDFDRNGRKYTPEDRERIYNIIRNG